MTCWGCCCLVQGHGDDVHDLLGLLLPGDEGV